MLADLPILSMIIFSPLLGVLILLFLPKDNGKWIKTVGIAATFIPLALSVLLYAAFDNKVQGTQFAENIRWLHVLLNQEGNLEQYTSYFFEFNYHVAVDGLSMPLVFLTALIAAMAALASVHIKKRWKTFYIHFLILEVGMFGVFTAQDLFLFFLFFELTLIPMFFLIGIWGYMERERAANRYLIYNGIGSAIMIVAFFILVNTAGFTISQNGQEASIHFSGDVQTIQENLENPMSLVNVGGLLNHVTEELNPFYLSESLKLALFVMLLIAFGIKLPIFPFHTWMLKVHTEAPPSVVMIHSGVLLKMGAYGLIRFGVLLFPEQAKNWALVLAVLGVVNILYGAILAFVQKEFKLVLAYSSISHMGVVLLGIAAFNTIGMEGAVFQMVSHGLISALMFLIVGTLYERTGTTQLDELGGLAKVMPFSGGILMVAGMASLGLPSLSGFVSELLSFMGLFETMPVLTAIGMLGIILTAAYVLRAIMRITFGAMPPKYEGIRDARLVEAVPMITLVAFILLLGLFPAMLGDPMLPTLNQMMDILAVKVGG